MIDEHQQAAVAFLERDRMRHLAHLKYLYIFPADIDCYYVEEAGEGGVLLSHPTSMRARDKAAYPCTDYVLMPTAFTETAAHRLLDYALTRFASSNHLALKLSDDLTRHVFERGFHLTLMKSYLSYTTSQLESLSLDTSCVVVADRVQDEVATLIANNGHPREELNHHFADGASSFTIYEGGEPVSTCMIYRNFANVWEIGGLYTLETARRKGYARQVVVEALTTLLRRGLIPRYQAEHTNTASIALAESLGMNICLRFEHYTASRRAD